MRHLLLLLPLLLAPVAAPAAPELYRIDPSHTRIVFLVSHFGFSSMIGRFNKVDGRYQLDEDKPETGWAEVTIETDSVDTGDEPLDAILRGQDFFAAREHPQIRFRGDRIERTRERTAKLWGELTLRGISQPIALEVTYNRKGFHPVLGPLAPMVSGFSARAVIDRQRFGMIALRGFVGDQVTLLIEVEGQKE